MTPEEETAYNAVHNAVELLDSIQLSSNSKGLAVGCLLQASKTILDSVSSYFKYSRNTNEELLDSVEWQTVIMQMRFARLHIEGLVPTKLDRDAARDLVFDLKGFGYRMVMEYNILWVESWMLTAYQQFIKNGGFAGLSIKKYMAKMRPLPESTATTKKRVFGERRIDGEDTVEEEVLYNVKKKVRHKAPRLKRRMGRMERT